MPGRGEARSVADLEQDARCGPDADAGLDFRDVTFLSALENPVTGGAIALAVALHNIPEGISVSVPIFFATGRRGRAFALSFLSGLAEPLGGAVAAVALDRLLPGSFAGLVFAGVAGVMVYVSIDELLPTARQHGRSHEVLAGIVGGMAVMAVSLLLLK